MIRNSAVPATRSANIVKVSALTPIATRLTREVIRKTRADSNEPNLIKAPQIRPEEAIRNVFWARDGTASITPQAVSEPATAPPILR